jgi:DhnA family fructose-bisphosphate aldolase class Ia
MDNKQLRMQEMFDPTDGRSLVLDASNGMVFGALPGLEHFKEAIRPLLPLLDGIITSPGQIHHLDIQTHQDAAFIVRADWTNALRGTDFVLPPENIQYLNLLNPSDALDLGANALVIYFILGHNEQIEAECMKGLVNLALGGTDLGMPVIVDVQPIGPRVVLRNKAIELGASYALEGGADGVIVPWPGVQSLRTIQAMCSGMEVWVKPGDYIPGAPELAEALSLGIKGFWLDEQVLTSRDPVVSIQAWRDLVHSSTGV